MRQITIEEQRSILKVLVHNQFWADMMCMDTVCYGGNVELYRDQREYAKAVIGAFPKDVRDAYDAELRKVKADALRAQADEIENQS